MTNYLARILIITGAVLIIIGLVVLVSPKIRFLGHLPGDIRIEKEKFRFYFPIATCIVLSIILTIVINIFIGYR